ncbi:unnamed protein product [Ilex paraguariensis]|uniref:DUF7950 domain-containing protein n=2 Tax=Ilex paraguariensis TaxID=185542 RepID=A0ABC8S721_9AQUA
MMQTMNSYTLTAKTAEIMARYRPIAPKPEVTANAADVSENTSMPQNIRQSAYLRTVWPDLQSRPTRTRKRGRTAIAPPTVKRQRTCLQGLYPIPPPQVNTSPAGNLSFNALGHGPKGFPQLIPVPISNITALNGGVAVGNSCTLPANLVTLPLLPIPSSLTIDPQQAPPPETIGVRVCGGNKDIDLNTEAEDPEEQDFLQQLQGPTSPNIIAPQPVRPVGSNICVGCISDDSGRTTSVQLLKKPEEVEEEVESEALPAIVSDSNNKVRLANSAYKEMVGQPECSWLDTAGDGGGACKRIGGEVMLKFLDETVPVSSNGFSCWVRIEWGSSGKKDPISNGEKNTINAFCDAIRLDCESKDYLFAWKFHTRASSESASNF